MGSFATVTVPSGNLPQDTRWLASSHALDSARPGQVDFADFTGKTVDVAGYRVIPSGTPVAFNNGKVVPATNTLFSGFIADVHGVAVPLVQAAGGGKVVAGCAVVVHGIVNVDYLPTGAKTVVEAANRAAGNTAKVKADFVLVSNNGGA